MASAIDMNMLQPFIDAVDHFFRAMLAKPVTAGTPTTTRIAEESDKCVRAFVALGGEPPGTVTLVLAETAAVALARAFSRREVAFGSGDFRDAIGEIANIIAGHAAIRVPGRRFKVSCPVVNVGPPTNPAAAAKPGGQAADASVYSIQFTSDIGTFVIEVGLVGLMGMDSTAIAA